MEQAQHHNLPPGIVINSCVATVKARSMPVILINTNRQNVWIWQPLLAAELFSTDQAEGIQHRANMERQGDNIQILCFKLIFSWTELIFVKKTSFHLISVKASSGLRKMFSQCYYNQNGVWENVCPVILDENDKLNTTVYRKPTHTDMYLHWDSHHNIPSKYSVIGTLYHRANTICSTTQYLHNEEKHLNQALKKCKYPTWAINRARMKIKITTNHNNNRQTHSTLPSRFKWEH